MLQGVGLAVGQVLLARWHERLLLRRRVVPTLECSTSNIDQLEPAPAAIASFIRPTSFALCTPPPGMDQSSQTPATPLHV